MRSSSNLAQEHVANTSIVPTSNLFVSIQRRNNQIKQKPLEIRISYFDRIIQNEITDTVFCTFCIFDDLSGFQVIDLLKQKLCFKIP